MQIWTVAIIMGLWIVLGCGGSNNPLDDFLKDPDGGPIRSAVRTAVPVAHVAAISMASVRGDAPPYATTTNTCSSYPCAALVVIDLDDPTLPFALGDAGSVMVAGLWASDRQAILTATFMDTLIGSASFQVNSISTFPVVEHHSGGLKVVYADIDIDIDTEPNDTIALTSQQIQAEYERLDTVVPVDPEVSLGMDVWVVEVDDGATPQDYTDDQYAISGAGQYIHAGGHGSSTQALQLAMANAIVTWNCPHNPTSGLAAMNEVGTGASLPVVASALITFEPQCDGNAKVTLATGNYIAANGSSIPVDLSSP